MPYQKVSDKNLERCEAYLKSLGIRRATKGEKSLKRSDLKTWVWTFDDVLNELLAKAGF